MSLRKSLLVIGGLVAAFFVGALVVDLTQSKTIAKGTQVAGVYVGGLSEAQAQRALKRELSKPLLRPVTVNFGDLTFRLNPGAIDARVEVKAMVANALKESHSGWFVPRAWRTATGEKIDLNLPATVSYNHDRFRSWIDKTKRALDRPALDPHVDYSVDDVRLVPGRDGIEINRAQLVRRVSTALLSPKTRVVQPPGTTTKPKSTTEQVRGRTPTIVTVSLASKQVRLFKDFKLAKTYTVAVGQQAYETPAGLHAVQRKDSCPAWTPPDSDWVPKKLRGKTIPCGAANNPIRARFIAFDGSAGMHGTSDTGSLGSAASHGCIRMAIPDVQELYDQVSVGNPVFIG